MDGRHRVLLVCTHVVQYSSAVFRLMARHPQLEIQVAYCSLQGHEPGLDPEFGREVAWDVPLLDGYPWVQLPNRSPHPGLGRFFGLINPGLWKLVREGEFDAVVLYTGYRYASFWIGLAAAKTRGKPVLFGTDASSLRPRAGGSWKVYAKQWLWPRLFRWADAVIVPSSGGVALMRSLGIPSDRVALTPFVVNNDWWKEQAAHLDRGAVRRGWSLPEDAPVVLFCAKLQPWKRPGDLLHAFVQADVSGSYLMYAGEGPLRNQLEAEARALGIADRIRMLGFVNQFQLPAIYRGASLMVLPSEYEPFGVVVNEAMLCGCPVAVSGRVGARSDLVRPGETGFVFPCGDVGALAAILREALSDPSRLAQMGNAARERMETWSPRENVEGHVQAVGRILGRRSPLSFEPAPSRMHRPG
jgi:glycosyltransferase involved in cell wall biosynthesis